MQRVCERDDQAYGIAHLTETSNMNFQPRKVLRTLNRHGFTVLREGANHTIHRVEDGVQIAVPRHRKLKRAVRGMAYDAEVEWS